MTVTLYTARDVPFAGDGDNSPNLMKEADRIGGYIRDDQTGEILHDGRRSDG